MTVKEFFDSNLKSVDLSRYKHGEISFHTDRGCFILPTVSADLPKLTDGEQDAIRWAIAAFEVDYDNPTGTDEDWQKAEILRCLLNRLGLPRYTE